MRWRFRVASGHTFSDGTPVDAHAIVAAWSAAPTPLLAAVTAAGIDVVDVTLHAPADIRTFALPSLAVARPVRAGADWPAGTGPYRVDPASPARMLRLLARAEHSTVSTMQSDALPDTIDIRTFAGDMRAALDAGVDVAIARDAATLAYAAARSDYVTVPLPWSRTWVLATLTGNDATTDTSTVGADFPQALTGLPTRAPAPPYWWSECDETQPGVPAAGDRRVLYARDDETARAIAERIAALARDRTPQWLHDRLGPDATVTAAGVTQAELAAALRRQTALAVVLPLPRAPVNGCAALRADGGMSLLRGWHITPLIETRDVLAHRPGAGRLVVDADGTIRFRAP